MPSFQRSSRVESLIIERALASHERLAARESFKLTPLSFNILGITYGLIFSRSSQIESLIMPFFATLRLSCHLTRRSFVLLLPSTTFHLDYVQRKPSAYSEGLNLVPQTQGELVTSRWWIPSSETHAATLILTSSQYSVLVRWCYCDDCILPHSRRRS